MLLTLKTDKGYIYAYIEFDVVNQFGIQVENGDTLYIRDLWIHKEYKGKIQIAKFIKMLDKLEETEKVEGIYWARRKDKFGKKAFRKSKLFTRKICLRRTKCLN
jgi:hypothetical protein